MVEEYDQHGPPYGRRYGIRDNLREQYGASVLDMTLSLAKAVQEAGGTVYSAEDLERTTVKELILKLAHNNIRFVYTGKTQNDR